MQRTGRLVKQMRRTDNFGLGITSDRKKTGEIGEPFYRTRIDEASRGGSDLFRLSKRYWGRNRK